MTKEQQIAAHCGPGFEDLAEDLMRDPGVAAADVAAIVADARRRKRIELPGDALLLLSDWERAPLLRSEFGGKFENYRAYKLHAGRHERTPAQRRQYAAWLERTLLAKPPR